MRVSLVSIYVSDPNTAVKFYTEVLGFVSKQSNPEFMLQVVGSKDEQNGTFILLEPNNHPIAQSYQTAIYKEGLPCIVFGTKDLDSEYKRLKDLGVRFTQEPKQFDYGRTAVFDDSFGNYIQLFEE